MCVTYCQAQRMKVEASRAAPLTSAPLKSKPGVYEEASSAGGKCCGAALRTSAWKRSSRMRLRSASPVSASSAACPRRKHSHVLPCGAHASALDYTGTQAGRTHRLHLLQREVYATVLWRRVGSSGERAWTGGKHASAPSVQKHSDVLTACGSSPYAADASEAAARRQRVACSHLHVWRVASEAEPQARAGELALHVTRAHSRRRRHIRVHLVQRLVPLIDGAAGVAHHVPRGRKLLGRQGDSEAERAAAEAAKRGAARSGVRRRSTRHSSSG